MLNSINSDLHSFVDEIRLCEGDILVINRPSDVMPTRIAMVRVFQRNTLSLTQGTKRATAWTRRELK